MGVLFFLLNLAGDVRIQCMGKEVDIRKVVQQHAEIDTFFAGFSIKDDEMSQPGLLNNDVVAVLGQIGDEVRQCSRCELGTSRANAVPGAGNPNARLVFVGEAPGADEDAQGEPFVGRAGKLLDKIIAGMGLRRQDIFICNILKCRPPSNRDPKPEEIISCLPFLKRQLESMRPEIIVALGAHAAKTLLETNKPIGQLRGKFHEYYPVSGSEPIKFMATYHPAYLLRNYSQDNRRKVWEDMKKVLAEMGLSIPAK